MKINQIPYATFQAASQFPFNFCITFQCHDTKCLWNFLAELLHFGQKEPNKVQILRLLCPLMKVHPIPHASFETTRSRFIQILHHYSVSWNITPLYFFSSNLYTLEKKQFSDFWMVGWKFTKFLVSCLKLQVSFSLNFALLFSAMRDNSSVVFKLKLYMIWKKDHIKVQNLRFSTGHVKFHQICPLIGSFCWKYIKFQLRKYGGVMSHDPKERCKTGRKTDLLFQKWQEFGELWPEDSKLFQICTLIGFYYARCLMFNLKKYRGVIFHDT